MTKEATPIACLRSLPTTAFFSAATRLASLPSTPPPAMVRKHVATEEAYAVLGLENVNITPD